MNLNQILSDTKLEVMLSKTGKKIQYNNWTKVKANLEGNLTETGANFKQT